MLFIELVNLFLCVDYELRGQVSHLQPAIQRHYQQLVPCRGSLHYCQQKQQRLHNYDIDDVMSCKCHAIAVDSSPDVVVKLDDSDDSDSNSDCMSPTWQRRSDIDVTDVNMTFDSVTKCQQSLSSSSSSLAHLPACADRQRTLSPLTLPQNVLVSPNVLSTSDSSHTTVINHVTPAHS